VFLRFVLSVFPQVPLGILLVFLRYSLGVPGFGVQLEHLFLSHSLNIRQVFLRYS